MKFKSGVSDADETKYKKSQCCPQVLLTAFAFWNQDFHSIILSEVIFEKPYTFS